MSNFNIEIGKKALITTDNWFQAPSGRQMKTVFGTVHGIYSDKDTLGIETNAKSTNWYVVIGNMTIAGCQIHYAIKTDTCNFGEVEDYKVTEEGTVKKWSEPSRIYNADE